jgi:hypothetical protein
MKPQETAPEFDPAATLAAVREHRAEAKRRRTWGRSRLIPYRAELVKLRQAGGSYADLTVWLRKAKRVKMDSSSVRRYLQKLPELAAPTGAESD